MPDTRTPAELARRLAGFPLDALGPFDRETIKLAHEALSRLSQVEQERDASDAVVARHCDWMATNTEWGQAGAVWADDTKSAIERHRSCQKAG